jgi:hypothetical protein
VWAERRKEERGVKLFIREEEKVSQKKRRIGTRGRTGRRSRSLVWRRWRMEGAWTALWRRRHSADGIEGA